MGMEIFGIGTDIIECPRIGKMIEHHGELFLRRVYTEREIRYCQARKHAIEHFAGRWAAKEAILKAMGTGRSSWHCLDQRRDQKWAGRPAQSPGVWRRSRNRRGTRDWRNLGVDFPLSHLRDGLRTRPRPARTCP